MKASILTLILFSTLKFVTGQVVVTGTPFTKIKIENNANVYVRQDSTCSLSYADKSETNLMHNTVKNGTLIIDGTSNQDIHVTLPNLEGIEISGVGKVTGESNFNVDELNLKIDGDGKITLDVQAKKINATVSGFGKITLSGTAQEANFSIPGSGKIDAINLRTIKCNASISGIGKCMVDAIDELNSQISGAGSVSYKTRPKVVNESISGIGKVKQAGDNGNSKGDDDIDDDGESINVHSNPDTTRLTFGEDEVWFIGKKDSKHSKRKKTKPVWRGFEMGINTYLDNGGTFTLSPEKQNFDLRVEKSISVGLNLLQAQKELGNSNCWIFTGLGVTWNNYRFASAVYLENGDYTNAVLDTTSNMGHLKSKLVAVYLTAPVMFEVFTSEKKKNAFHFGIGGMFGARIGSHTKQKVEIAGDVSKLKEFDDFNLSPFRYGFRAAIGYGPVNVFADYYASTLFRENKGPVLYPVNFGITLIGF